MVRIVFRPYTQFRRQRFARQFLTTQASIKFSPDFTMSGNSSPSFGSQQKCSVAQLLFLFFLKRKKKEALVIAQVKTSVPSWPVMESFFKKKKNVLPFLLLSYFRYAVSIYFYICFFFFTTTHTLVELLGPCYKTGRTVVFLLLHRIFRMFVRSV